MREDAATASEDKTAKRTERMANLLWRSGSMSGPAKALPEAQPGEEIRAAERANTDLLHSLSGCD